MINNKTISKLLLWVAGVALTAFGAALSMYVAVGVSAWDGIAQNINHFTGIKVGTANCIINSCCIIIELLVLKKDFKLKHALQLALCLCLGSFINFFYYTVLVYLPINTYISRLIFFLISQIVCSFGIGMLMAIDLVGMPLEGACLVCARAYNLKFTVLRQGVDLVCIIISLILTFAFKAPLVVREGTVIGMLIFGPMEGIYMKFIKKHLKNIM